MSRDDRVHFFLPQSNLYVLYNPGFRVARLWICIRVLGFFL